MIGLRRSWVKSGLCRDREQREELIFYFLVLIQNSLKKTNVFKTLY